MHNLFGSRFVSHREPAWHALGLVLEEELGAAEAFGRMGPYDVFTAAVGAKVRKEYLALPNRVIVRSPTADDPRYRTFGLVGPDYALITPQEVCQIWDEHVARPVETIGALGQGETLFISTRLPAFSVLGDEVENYLLAVSPMTGGTAAEVRVTPVRVVCQNTLVFSAIRASEVYRIVHKEGAKAQMADWLTDAYQRAEQRSEVLAEAFEVLARHKVAAKELTAVAARAYPYPKTPRDDAPPDVMERRLADANYGLERQQYHRRAVQQLFEGDGTGMEHPAMAGTAWGLFNAVSEYENYRRGRGDISIAKDTLFGYRAWTISQAFEACSEISKN
jgi:phage/plasmid-like protein (TIGR03299 family)